jgi:hypothetical protein
MGLGPKKWWKSIRGWFRDKILNQTPRDGLQRVSPQGGNGNSNGENNHPQGEDNHYPSKIIFKPAVTFSVNRTGPDYSWLGNAGPADGGNRRNGLWTASGISLSADPLVLMWKSQYKRQTSTWMNTGRVWGSYSKGFTAGNPALLKYANYARWGGFLTGAYITAWAYADLVQGNTTHFTRTDATIGTLGFLNSFNSLILKNTYSPLLGKFVLLYGAARFGYEAGVHYGPSKWFRPKPFQFSPSTIPNINFYEYMQENGF